MYKCIFNVINNLQKKKERFSETGSFRLFEIEMKIKKLKIWKKMILNCIYR